MKTIDRTWLNLIATAFLDATGPQATALASGRPELRWGIFAIYGSKISFVLNFLVRNFSAE